MRAERIDLPIERARRYRPRCRRGPTRRGRPAGPCGGEPAAGPATERPSGCAPRGRPRRPRRCPRSVVGVVDPAVPIDDRLGIGGEHRVRLKRPDLADEVLAQDQVVREGAVRHVEEGDPGVPDDVGGGALLALAQGRELEGIGVGILAPASPLVQHTSQPTDPLSIQRRPSPAGPNSASSGCAAMTMNLSGRQSCGWVAALPARSFLPRLAAPRASRAGHDGPRPASRVPRRAPRGPSAAWPSALTFGQTRTIRPSGSIRNVDRPTPMYVLPERRFSPHAP